MRLVCLSAVLLAACSGSTQPEVEVVEAPPAARPNVVLVTMDTVRVDHIGAYGYDPATTPTIDALAASGRRFERAYSPYPLTIPSHSSMMTGLYPPQHGVRDNGDNVLNADLVTLAEVLQGEGYDTVGSVAAFVTSRQWGFEQGFDAYFDDVPRADDFWHASRRGEAVVDDVLGWLDERESEEPAFVWAHMYDAHMPFEPPSPYKEAHEGRAYDGEIAYVDAQIARLVKAFEGQETLFVITSDHGEGLGEHFEITHGLFVYNTTQHVPLILSGAGVPTDVIDQPVSLVDIMPTVLDHLKIELPEDLAGRPVPSEEDRPVYMESWQPSNRYGLAPHIAVVSGDHKLISVPRPELYALDTDQPEREDQAAAEADRVAELQAILDSFGFEAPSASQSAVSSEVSEELAALGYVVGTRPDQPVEELPDPKDHLGLIKEIQKTDRRLMADPADALAVLKKLDAKYPAVAEIKVRMSQMLLSQGKFDEVEDLITRAIAEGGESTQFSMVLSAVLLQQGNNAEAAEILYALREERGYSPRYRVKVVRTMLAAGRTEEAEALAAEFMAEYPEDLELPGLIGVHLVRTDREALGMPMLERASAAEDIPPDVAFVMGMRAAAQRDRAGAVGWFEKEVEHHPFNARARRLLGVYAMEAKDWKGWGEHTGHLVRVAPKDPAAWRDHAQARFNLEEYPEARKALDRSLELAPTDPNTVLLDANLLAKEGKRDAGLLRFEEAQRLQKAASK